MRGFRLAVVALLLAGALLPIASASGQSTSSRAPVALQLSMAPPVLPADGHSYPALVISLLDASNLPTLSLNDVLVYLSTTNSTVASVPRNVTILAGHTFVQVNVGTSTKPGTANLGATSQGLTSSEVQVSTAHAGSSPSLLSIYLSLRSTVQALQGSDDMFVVQLKTSTGQPAVSSSNTSLVITSSNSTMLPGTIKATIPPGSNLIYGSLDPQAWGTTTLTVLSPNLGTGAAILTVSRTPKSITVSVTPPAPSNGFNASVLITVAVLGMPVQSANVAAFSSLGAISPAVGSTDSQGQFSTTYISGGTGPAFLNVTAYSPVIGTMKTLFTLIVGSGTSTTSEVSSNSVPGISILLTYLPVVVVVAVVAVALVIVRGTLRRRRGATEDEYSVPDSKA